MSSSYALGPHFEAFIQAQLATGRYADASDVIRAALRLLEEDDKKYAELDAAIFAGLADIEAGDTVDAETVFDELEAELRALSEQAAE
jgi:antitoxin ParD1/3/4